MAADSEPGLGLDLPVAARPPRANEAYRVLARKYRPSDFTGLIGQEALVRTLRNAFASGRIAHAFMLTGVRGVGKTTTARIIARALNCIGPDGKRTSPTIDPCGVCEPCRAIAESRHMDVLEMDAASRTGIDDVREIIEGTRYAPASARYKVYVIDEVHMLSKAAFNGLLKTLEEPPPHVKFVFATTEIRKVPVTVLSRCQRFDLRRIETARLAAHLSAIAEQERVAIEPAALSLVARAAEGSVRDALSLLDQAIAHHAGDEGSGPITGGEIRSMLGTADRGRILDLFERLMAGQIAHALSELRDLYDGGADPLVIVQDLLETTHFLTRVKVAPGAEGFFDGGSAEAARAVTMAGKLTVPALTRAWQILLKGLLEVRDAANPLPAAEMALVRLAYAADLPPADRLIRSLRDGEGQSTPGAPARSPAPAGPSGPRASIATASAAPAASRPEPQAREQVSMPPAVSLRTLEDIIGLAKEKGARLLATQLESNVHLVALEEGRLTFRPDAHAPTTLAGDLAQRLKDWTGTRWLVSVAREGGGPTLLEQRAAADRAKKDAVANEPFVRAVLDAFPGAEIVAVREREVIDATPEIPDSEEPS